MKHLRKFNDLDITTNDIIENQLEITIEGEDFSFDIVDDDVFFTTDEDEQLANKLGIVMDEELKSYILKEYYKIQSKTRMKRFGFFKESIRDQYSKMGVNKYYSNHKQNYINPHEERIQSCIDWVTNKIEIDSFLDLACGNGEVSSYLKIKGYNNFKGCDPYFKEIFEKRFNKECYNLSFEDISKKSLPQKFNTIICSYALHLCNKSYFNNLLWNLSMCCENFIVISPSKYPLINEYFTLVDSTIINRTHCRIYKSNYYL